MNWRPPIDDPTNGHSFDERVLCSRCGKGIDMDEDLEDGTQICDDCHADMLEKGEGI